MIVSKNLCEIGFHLFVCLFIYLYIVQINWYKAQIGTAQSIQNSLFCLLSLSILANLEHMRSDSLPRLWRYINLLLTYLLTSNNC